MPLYDGGYRTGVTRERAASEAEARAELDATLRSLDVDVRAGRATGWTDKTYPWPQDKPGGAIEPLLLPWGGVGGLSPPSIMVFWRFGFGLAAGGTCGAVVATPST